MNKSKIKNEKGKGRVVAAGFGLHEKADSRAGECY